MAEATQLELVEQLRALGVRPGGVLLVHTSFRAVRPVKGGPHGLIAALRAAIGPGGTLVMPTMTDGEGVFDPRSTPTAGKTDHCCHNFRLADDWLRARGLQREGRVGHADGRLCDARRRRSRARAPRLGPARLPVSSRLRL